MKSTKVSAGRFTAKAEPRLQVAVVGPGGSRGGPPQSYVDPDNFGAAVQVLCRAREELLTAADRADFAARKAGTPIRTHVVRAKIEELSVEVRRIERIIMDSAAEEFQNRGSRVGQLAQSIGTIKRGRRADLVFGEEEGSDAEGCFPLNPHSGRLRSLRDVLGRSQWARSTRENVGYTRGFNRRGLAIGMDLVFATKRTPAPKQTPVKGGSSSGKVDRDLLLKMSPAEVAKLTVAELSRMLAAITSLGSFEVTEKDFQALVLIIDALEVALRGDPNAAAKVLDEFGAKNMETLLSNIRQRLLFDTAYYSPEDRKLAEHMLEEFSLLARLALQSPGYYENEHALQTFLRDNPITVSILLLQPSTPPPSSKMLALLAGRILPDPGASRILNLKSSPGKTARMLLLDALELDQKNGGDSVERYLFDNLANPFWPSPDIRQNTLLVSHKFPSVGDVRGDVNDERTADMFLAAVVGRFNTNKLDVLNLFKSAVEGKFSNNGASFTEEGQFAMAHILSMLMNEQSLLQQGKDVPVSYATHLENFILNGGNYNLHNLDFRKFIGFVGSIGQSKLAGAEIMIGLNSYLASKGGALLLSNPVAPASVIGVLVDAIRDETARRNGNNNAIVEFLVGAVLVAGAAAYAPEALAAAATAGLVLSEVQKRAVVEVSKNVARQVAKNASKALAPSTQDLQSLRSQMQVLYSLNIFSTLSDQMKTEMLNDPKIKPFVVGSAIQPPLVGSFAVFEGKRREITENDRQQFGFRITYYIPPTNSSVLAFSNAFVNQFVG